MDTAGGHSSHSAGVPAGTLQAVLSDALAWWEPRRLIYNLALAVLVVVYFIATWPHFRAASNLDSLPGFFVLAVLANICYCAAYAVDVPVQLSSHQALWRRWRWCLWLTGTLFACTLAWHWLGDEIYPAYAG